MLEGWPNILQAFNGYAHVWFELGEAVGLPFTMAGSTRYDLDAYLIVRVHRDTGDVVFESDACIAWGSQQSSPYSPAEPCGAPALR